MYNLTELQAVSTISELAIYSNDVTSGLLVILFIIAIFFIMLMALKRYDFESALLVSSWISFILSALLVYAKVLNMIWALIFLIVAAMTAFYMYVLKAG